MSQSASQRLHEIAVRLREEANRGARLELNRTIRAAAQPLIAEVRGAAYVSLPKRGGLNEEQGNQRITVSVLTGSTTAGVRLRTRTRGSFQTDKGYVRHPTPTMLGYDRSYWHWVKQDIPQAEGWWSKTLERSGRKYTPAIVAAMNRIARRITTGSL